MPLIAAYDEPTNGPSDGSAAISGNRGDTGERQLTDKDPTAAVESKPTPCAPAVARTPNYDPKLKLEILRRVQEEGLSCRQAAALFNIGRFSQVPTRVRGVRAHRVPA